MFKKTITNGESLTSKSFDAVRLFFSFVLYYCTHFNLLNFQITVSNKLYDKKVSNESSTHNVSTAIKNVSTSDADLIVSKNKTTSELKNSVDVLDSHLELNTSSTSDEFLLEAISQIETVESQVYFSEVPRTVSREDTPSPVMDLGDSLSNPHLIINKTSISSIENGSNISNSSLSEHNINRVTTNLLQLPSNTISETTRDDTPSPVMNLGFFDDPVIDSGQNMFSKNEPINKNEEFNETQLFDCNKESVTNKFDSIDECTQLPNEDDEDLFKCTSQDINLSFNLNDNHVPFKTTCGLKKCSKQNIDNHNIEPSLVETTNENKNKKITNTFDVDPDDDDILFYLAQKVENDQISTLTNKNLTETMNPKAISNDNLTLKIHKEETQKLLTHPEINNDENFFDCPTQKLSMFKKKNFTSKLSASSNKCETQFSRTSTIKKTDATSTNTNTNGILDNLTQILKDMDSENCSSSSQKTSISVKTNTNTNKTLIFSKIENLTQLPNMDDEDFFNCPTQKVSISKKDKLFVTPSTEIHTEVQKHFGPPHSNTINTNTNKTLNCSIHEELTQLPEMDNEDFFNCSTQKVTISKKINLPVNLSIATDKEKTLKLSKLPQVNKVNTNINKTFTTSVHKDLTQLPSMNDEDFFNCPTQKLSISKKQKLPEKILTTIHKEEPQKLSMLPQFDQSNSITSKKITTNIDEDLTQIPELNDEQLFHCSTQKLSTSNKKDVSVVKLSTSIHEEETQKLSTFPQVIKIGSLVNEICTTKIHENLTRLQSIDDEDFFNCPSQKYSLSKKNNLPVKLSTTIQKEDLQNLPGLTRVEKNTSHSSKTDINNTFENVTKLLSVDNEDFFNCPTQKLSISKKNNLSVKLSTAVHEEETQQCFELQHVSKIGTKNNKMFNSNVHKDLIQMSEMDSEDFFNCPTQKIPISKKTNSRVELSTSVSKKETQKSSILPEVNKIDTKTNKILTTRVHEDFTQLQSIDDEDFFNCPTQKVSIFKKEKLPEKSSTTVHKEETQTISEHSQFNETSINSTKPNNARDDLTRLSGNDNDEDIFYCSTQILPLNVGKKSSATSEGHEALNRNDVESQKLFLQSSNSKTSVSNMSVCNNYKQNKENIVSCITKNICSKNQTSVISNRHKETNENETQDLKSDNDCTSHNLKLNLVLNNSKIMYTDHHDSDEHKLLNQYNTSESVDKCTIRKSTRLIANNKLNEQLLGNCSKNQNSLSSSKPVTKSFIRVRKDLHTTSFVESNNKNFNINESTQNNVLNSKTNTNVNSPSSSKITCNRSYNQNQIVIKQEPITDESAQCKTFSSHMSRHQSNQINESIFSPFNVPNLSTHSVSVENSTLNIVAARIDPLCQPSTSNDAVSEWQSFWNKKKIADQEKKKNNKRGHVHSKTDVEVKKERYQTRAITRKDNNEENNRKRKQNGNSNDVCSKKICSKDIEISTIPLVSAISVIKIVLNNYMLCLFNNVVISIFKVENSSETVVTFSYLKSRHLQQMKDFVDKTGIVVLNFASLLIKISIKWLYLCFRWLCHRRNYTVYSASDG